MSDAAKRTKKSPSGAALLAGSFAVGVGALFWPFLRPALRRVAPYMPAGEALTTNTVRAITQLHLHSSNGRRMVDLGSGDGIVLLRAAMELPSDWTFVGVENNLWLVLASHLRAMRAGVSNRVSFVCKDLCVGFVCFASLVAVCLTRRTAQFVGTSKIWGNLMWFLSVWYQACSREWRSDCANLPSLAR